MSESHFESRIAELKKLPLEEGDEPINDISIEAARRFLNEPFVTASPNGEIYLSWHKPKVTLCFRRDGTIGVVARQA